MTYILIGAALALSSFVAVHAGAELVVAMLWRIARRHSDGLRPATYAAGLFFLRALPSVVAALVVGGAILPAFGRFEPRETQETLGGVMLLTAGVGGAIVLRTLWLAWHAQLATRRLVRFWTRSARTVDLPGVSQPINRLDASMPIIAVAGTLRSRLFVSDAVLDACTEAEVGAIVAHELGHIESYDNLKALVFRCVPELLPMTSAGRDLERAWKEAAEEAADDHAAGRQSPLDLASALIKVAKIGRSGPADLPSAVVASAFYRAENLERRVRRLLRPHAAASTRRPRWLVAAYVLSVAHVGFVAAALANAEMLRRVHGLLEVLVKYLP